MNGCIKSITSHFLILSILFIGACCPSGVWEDNYGNIYSIVSIPPGNLIFGPVRTYGTVDITDSGCGTWEIRPLNEFDTPPLPASNIVWIAENPEPDQTGECCDAVRFEGYSLSRLQCDRIIGVFHNLGRRCTQSGNMFLDVQGF